MAETAQNCGCSVAYFDAVRANGSEISGFWDNEKKIECALFNLPQPPEIWDPLAPTASKQVFQKTEISDPLAPTAAK
jgi:hypothetical protein